MTSFRHAERATGLVCIVLHAHLPYVRHPEESYFLEENWLYEAITETYIPLLEVFQRLVEDAVDFRFTVSLSPSLICMFRDPLLQTRYLRHLDTMIELADKELHRTAGSEALHTVARMYHRRLHRARQVFTDVYGYDLCRGFKRFAESGQVELITTCATHGYLPHLSVNPACIDAQIRVGLEVFEQTFHVSPRGFWLPECGYCPDIERHLEAAGIDYFFLDRHGLVHAEPRPQFDVYAPVRCSSGVAVFGRDPASSRQVWSAQEGYPGDFDYREYYSDLGFEADLEYIKPYIHPLGIRINTGFKYRRITGPAGDKQVYRPGQARARALQHAAHFVQERQRQVAHLAAHMPRQPLIVAPFDAELFGHWWYEGPLWLEALARHIGNRQETLALVTPSEYLARYPENQLCMPAASSWGYRGYGEFWLEPANDWLYPYLHHAGAAMVELGRRFGRGSGGGDRASPTAIERRALHQAARELLLAEASDWAFIMKTGTMVAYARRRVQAHLSRFDRLYRELTGGRIAEDWLRELEWRDNVFGGIRCGDFYGPGQ